MGAQLDRLRYEVFQSLFYSPMDAGILRAAVATAPTVYGIETLTVSFVNFSTRVATAPTVYGIETVSPAPLKYLESGCNSTYRLRY